MSTIDRPAPGSRDEDPDPAEKLLAECDVTTFRASGPGGQHRNRRESGVRLRHRPTGTVVVATERRSQHRNRAIALERLARKLAARRRRRKVRRATRPTKAARERRLEHKRKRSTTKAGRGKVSEED